MSLFDDQYVQTVIHPDLLGNPHETTAAQVGAFALAGNLDELLEDGVDRVGDPITAADRQAAARDALGIPDVLAGATALSQRTVAFSDSATMDDDKIDLDSGTGGAGNTLTMPSDYEEAYDKRKTFTIANLDIVDWDIEVTGVPFLDTLYTKTLPAGSLCLVQVSKKQNGNYYWVVMGI